MAEAFLDTRFERGSISTSVGDIVAFFLTVLAAYLLSAFIRFVLEEDVYSTDADRDRPILCRLEPA